MIEAFVISFVLTLVICIVYDLYASIFRRKKDLQKAIDKGHVVQAKLVDVSRLPRDDDSFRDNYRSTYIYEVNGKTYKRHLTSENDHLYDKDNTYTWYYRRWPSKARDAEDICRIEFEWIYIFVVLFVLNLIIFH